RVRIPFPPPRLHPGLSQAAGGGSQERRCTPGLREPPRGSRRSDRGPPSLDELHRWPPADRRGVLRSASLGGCGLPGAPPRLRGDRSAGGLGGGLGRVLRRVSASSLRASPCLGNSRRAHPAATRPVAVGRGLCQARPVLRPRGGRPRARDDRAVFFCSTSLVRVLPAGTTRVLLAERIGVERRGDCLYLGLPTPSDLCRGTVARSDQPGQLWRVSGAGSVAPSPPCLVRRRRGHLLGSMPKG